MDVTWQDVRLLMPECFILTSLCALLMVGLYVSDARKGILHFLAIAILAGGALLVSRSFAVEAQTAFGGLFIRDGVGDFLKLGICIVAILVFIYAKPYLLARSLFQAEYYALCLSGVLGAMLLVSAGNLLMIYLGLELLALSSYALVALHRDSPLCSEAAIKYFVLGALASGMLLYGMSMLYGGTGTLQLDALAALAGSLSGGAGNAQYLVYLGLVFVVVGVAFKFGAVPFHMWVPDVYQGSPTAITAFIGSMPKIAAFGMAYRLFAEGLAPLAEHWQNMFALLALASLAVGNIVAIAQTNLKRMLAYSTISHVGFLLLGFVGGTAEGYAAAMFYALTYALTAAAAFGMIILLARQGFEAENIADFSGLNQRNAWFALLMLMVMASLAGIPIWVGFVAKLAVLKAAIQGGYLWLAIAAGLFAVIGAFYYLRVIKVMYFDEPQEIERVAAPADALFLWTLSANALALLGLGIFSGPLFAWCLELVKR